MKVYIHPLFIFEHNVNEYEYNLYIFNDFSNAKQRTQDNVFNALDKIRLRIYKPKTIFIICHDSKWLDKTKNKERFTDNQDIKYIDYSNVSNEVFQQGIKDIVENNQIVQYAPTGTIFKKTSNDESNYFIKTSLALLKYPYICFLALAVYKKMNCNLSNVQKIYIDVGSITSLIQAIIHYYNTFVAINTKYTPEIINFESYKPIDDNINLGFDPLNSFMIMSASTSGGLRKKLNINSKFCLTIFYPNNQEKCLYELTITEKDTESNLKPIPLTSDDFSLEYSKSEEVIVTKDKVQILDKKHKLIDKILSDSLKKISIRTINDEYSGNPRISFKSQEIYEELESVFIKTAFEKSLTSELDNYIIYDHKIPKIKTTVNSIKINDFTGQNGDNQTQNKNIIVFLVQTTNDELINISQILRKHKVKNITYIIGILLTKSFQQSKNLKNNICFNHTNYQYNFDCYLNLPLLSIDPDFTELQDHSMSDGFVFYNDEYSSKLKPQQVYLVICLILELLRNDNQLSDNISYYDVISPENFHRFNDPLLQLSFLKSAKGRELNFQSNQELSHKMKDVILSLKKEEIMGDIFIEALVRGKITLIKNDKKAIKEEYPKLFESKF